MKWLDKYLQKVRIEKVSQFIDSGSIVLDIGSGTGEMFKKNKQIRYGIGIEPNLEKEIVGKNYKIFKGYFPQAKQMNQEFDTITLMAVLEHIPVNEQQKLAVTCMQALKIRGKLIITVPSAKVDLILNILKKFKLIDGMSLEQHYGFNVSDTSKIFCYPDFRMVVHQKFQLGLNNLFVFEKL